MLVWLAPAPPRHPFDFLPNELFDDPRKVLVEPLLEHWMEEFAGQIVDASGPILGSKHLFGKPAESACRHIACGRRDHAIRWSDRLWVKPPDAAGTLAERRPELRGASARGIKMRPHRGSRDRPPHAA